MGDEIILETKLVGDINGTFFVPSYQRGYRWGKDEVTRLLEDIYSNGDKNYCLQPIVVRRSEDDRFELIDGQQRLTTLFILLKYIKREYKPKIVLKYRLSYDTHEESEHYLNNIDEEQSNSNIDFFHIYGAYNAIEKWFESQTDSVVVADDIYRYLVKYVKVIWYVVKDAKREDGISLFTRLNIGKIPLTNAELVKAMFLSRDRADSIDREKQEEISLQWDNIEKELHNDSLWYFLTNSPKNRYQTRIDLILDLIAEKPQDSREKYYAFFKFDEMRKNSNLKDMWIQIQQTFLILKEWFEKHELYHKIGYLIASGNKTLRDVYKQYKSSKTKDVFIKSLNRCMIISENCSTLRYDKQSDYKKISTLLLLFNVESVRRNGESTQWFPFDKLKYNKDGKVSWSLEHIHAQQSEGMRTQEIWKEWLKLHIPSVEAVGINQEELIESMYRASNEKTKLERAEFDKLQQRVIEILSENGNTTYLHSIANLALLNTGDNAALNNSTFDVKRNNIIKRDRNGQFIPFCTKMVFLKYYTPSAQNQLHFWGQADRKAYVEEINKVLKDYLTQPITLD